MLKAFDGALWSIGKEGTLYRTDKEGTWKVFGKKGTWKNTRLITGEEGVVWSIEKDGSLWQTVSDGKTLRVGKPGSWSNTKMIQLVGGAFVSSKMTRLFTSWTPPTASPKSSLSSQAGSNPVFSPKWMETYTGSPIKKQPKAFDVPWLFERPRERKALCTNRQCLVRLRGCFSRTVARKYYGLM